MAHHLLHRPRMRSLLLLGLIPLVLPTLAHTAHAEAVVMPPRVDVAVGFGLGLVHVGDRRMEEGVSGAAAGLTFSASYRVTRSVGVVADASLWHAALGDCYADGACYTEVAERPQTLTAGVRLFAGPTTYVQGMLGAARSTYDRGGRHEQWWSPSGVVALGWRRPITDAVLGFELRATALRHDETLVLSAAAVVSGGYAW